ncbi:hypothetical protein NDU88_001312 [Pleurodeles waltl]|uniref:Uncharacterized protein n=1 Tax=Pleurodeles waltl TaxID=8319 RepID=A0AAV7SZX2_PLEWA|nr:hypothetical protein NDU88_001312 [Pleurodeles waltl]
MLSPAPGEVGGVPWLCGEPGEQPLRLASHLYCALRGLCRRPCRAGWGVRTLPLDGRTAPVGSSLPHCGLWEAVDSSAVTPMRGLEEAPVERGLGQLPTAGRLVVVAPGRACDAPCG